MLIACCLFHFCLSFFLLHRETYAVDWEVPAEGVAAQLANAKLGNQRSSLSSMVVPEDDVVLMPVASASARSSTSSSAYPATSSLPASARGSMSSAPPQTLSLPRSHSQSQSQPPQPSAAAPASSSVNSYAAPTHDFGVVHEFHRVLDAAGTGLFYYVHMTTGAVQWNVPESWKQVQALEAQMLSQQTSALPAGNNNRANFTTAPAALPGLPQQQGRHATSKSLSSDTDEVLVSSPSATVSAVRAPGSTRSVGPPGTPSGSAGSGSASRSGSGSGSVSGSGSGSGAHPPPASRGPPPLGPGMAGPGMAMGMAASGGPRPPPLPPGPNPHAATNNNNATSPTGGFRPTPPSGPPPPPVGAMFPNSPSSAATSPKVGGGAGGAGGLSPMSPANSSSSAAPALAPVAPHAPEPTLINNVLAGPPGGTQQYGPNGKPVALLSAIADDIRNFALKGFASNHFRTFKKRTGIVSRTNIDVDELLSWQRTVIAKSLLTSTKKYTSDAVSPARVDHGARRAGRRRRGRIQEVAAAPGRRDRRAGRQAPADARRDILPVGKADQVEP